MTSALIVTLCASVCFATASVLQHSGAMEVHYRPPLHPGLLTSLVRSRAWLAGVAAQAVGVSLHLVAVNLGPLSVVQPMLTVGLVIALVLQRLRGRRVGPAAWFAAGLVVLGLCAFLAVIPTLPGSAPLAAPLDMARWAPGMGAAGLLAAAAFGVGLFCGGTARCVCFGASAGVLMATSAALGKVGGAVLGANGLAGLVDSWPLWVALSCGAAGTLLSQAAFQAGPLGGSLAAMMAIDPVVGVGLGIMVFGERFATSGYVETIRLAGLAVTLLGVGLLASAQRQGRSVLCQEDWPSLVSQRSRKRWSAFTRRVGSNPASSTSASPGAGMGR